MKDDMLTDPDLRLAAHLIARRLKDRSIAIDPDAIAISTPTQDAWRPQIIFRYLFGEMPIRVQSNWSVPSEVSVDTITKLASEQADAVERAWDERADLAASLKEAKALAKREVAKAERRGADWKLLSVEPSIIDAGDGSTPAPQVDIEMLDRTLSPDRYGLIFEDVADFRDELANVLDEQISRAARRKRFGGSGACGAIDSVVTNVIRQAGLDIADVIRRMRASDLGFQQVCGDRNLSLWWKDGLITASFTIADGVSYREGTLTVQKTAKVKTRRGLVGKAADSVIDFPALEGMSIIASGTSFGSLSIEMEPCYLPFDEVTCLPSDEPTEI